MAVVAAVSFASTGVVARWLPAESYAVWALMLVVLNYVWLFDLGVQPTVTKMVAAVEGGTDAWIRRGEIVSTAAALLTGAGAVGLAVLAVGVLVARAVGIPGPESSSTFGWCLAVTGASALICLPHSALSGYYAGMMRSHVAVVLMLPGRLAGSIGVAVAAYMNAPLLALAIVLAAGNLVSVAALAGYRESRAVLRLGMIARPLASKLLRTAWQVGVGGIAIYVIVNLDGLLVAIFDLASVGPYAAAATLVTFLASMMHVAGSSLLPRFAGLDAGSGEFGRLLRQASRCTGFLTLALVLPLLVGANPLMSLWLGAANGRLGARSLTILLLALLLRQQTTLLGHALLAAGHEARFARIVWKEAATNVGMSIPLGAALGAPGVALGTLTGSIVGLVTGARSADRVVPGVTRALLLQWAAAVPIVAPPVMLLGVSQLGLMAGTLPRLALGAATCVCGWMWAYRSMLRPSDRQFIRGLGCRLVPASVGRPEGIRGLAGPDDGQVSAGIDRRS
ncbi:MAG: oligosaccharide flippase family protein [Acidimicrobiia bacterium]